MTPSRQGDLFGQDGPDPSDDDFETPTFYPDADEVRSDLNRILSEMKAAERMPWDESKAELYKTIFPQMTQALPDDEGAQLRFEFETELERLKAA